MKMDKRIAFSLYDIELCKKKLGNCNQLAFGVMLAYCKIYTKSPYIEEQPIPSWLISSIAEELNVEPQNLAGFNWNGRTAKRFRSEIREYLGLREPTDHDATAFIEYLRNDILPNCPSTELLLEQSRLYFFNKKTNALKTNN
tara:strand:- start:855 stop:1280 length:426 start_codon:yes stop_codon:yes gene_type:complete